MSIGPKKGLKRAKKALARVYYVLHRENIKNLLVWNGFKLDVLYIASPSGPLPKIVSEYDHEIPQSQPVDNPMASRGRAAQPSRDTRKTN